MCQAAGKEMVKTSKGGRIINISSGSYRVHYATRAVGGVGLIIVEATGVQFNGRITEACLGIWDDKFIPGLKRIVDVIHQFGANAGIQLSHAGRKSGVPGLEVGPSAIAVRAKQ